MYIVILDAGTTFTSEVELPTGVVATVTFYRRGEHISVLPLATVDTRTVNGEQFLGLAGIERPLQ